MIRYIALALMLVLAGPATAQQDGSVLIVPPEDDGMLIRPVPRGDGELIEPEIDGEDLLEPDLDLNFVPDDEIPEDPQVAALTAGGATLRALDRMSNEVEDLSVSAGQTAEFGRLQVTMGECRYPEDNPSGDAYAFLVIREAGEEEPLFQGWMVASSPALNALDDPRYDVWVLSCNIS